MEYAALNGLLISNLGSLGEAVEKADKVFTVNSTGGARSSHGKKVVCFGESYYQQWRAEDVCIYYDYSLISDDMEIVEGIKQCRRRL